MRGPETPAVAVPEREKDWAPDCTSPAGEDPRQLKSSSAVRVRRMAARTWWTRERVVAGLRRFYQDHHLAPTSTEEWHHLTGRHGHRDNARGGRRSFPSLYAVLRHFETFRQAWAAVGIDVGRRQESWSELEDWYLREAIGLISRVEIARDLNRTPEAIHRHQYDLGLHSYQRWGWTLHRVERIAQVPRHRLQTYLERGDLPYLRGSKCIYVDPADLLVVSEIDWTNPPADLEDAALHAWRERLVKVLAGNDWRAARPFRAQPVVRTDRRWGPRMIRPAARPIELEPGNWVEVVEPVERRPYCLGRVGRVHLVFWSVNRGGGHSARSAPEPQWMARVEFTSQHPRSLGPRVTYTLPLTCLRVVSALVSQEDEHAHP